jgi:predicted HTH transcriptional regulator
MAIRKSIADITQNDLENLIRSEVPEDQTIEYKRDLNISSEEARREFFRDISSFANASGGDIIFGIRAVNGKPQALSPLN